MKRLMKDKTSFLIVHWLFTIRNAESTFEANDGRIVEQGNHDELMEEGGMYSELYYSQFENYT